MLDFIKKYPMSILLAIIAINLFSIAGSLRESSKISSHIDICAKFRAFTRNDNNEKADKYEEKGIAKIGLKNKRELISYCYSIVGN